MSICPACQQHLDQEHIKFCPNCGAQVTQEQIICPTCQQTFSSGTKFCPEDGTPLVPSLNTTNETTRCPVNTSEMQLKTFNTGLTILLTFITAGVYIPCWFLSRRNAINQLHSNEKLNTWVFIGMLVVLGFSLFLSLSPIAEEAHDFSNGLDSLAGLLIMVQSFKVHKIFNDHFNTYLNKNIKFSRVATFFFSIMYFQYKINHLKKGA